jgi:DNA-binding transcriptional MocR family regulator
VNAELPQYLRIAQAIENQIALGALRVGERVPSIRGLSRQRGVSISTILQAYFWLENRGYIESRPQSGFYVRVPCNGRVPEPTLPKPDPEPTAVGTKALLSEIIHASSDAAKIPLGASSPSHELLPIHRLNLILRQTIRQDPLHSSTYELPPGYEPLRHQIARRALAYGCTFSPRQIVITSGAMEALNLSLRAVARAGDVIAIESPTYFGVLQAIESLAMRAVEIPTHSREGMDLDALSKAIRKYKVRACVAMTNCHNPLGYVLSDERKKALVELTAKHSVPLIEDDVYGDLVRNGPRPKPAKAFDQKGLVLLCSSFSKVLSPGFRIGWIQPGKFQAEVERLQFITTVATPSLPQKVIARFLETGGYERHLRRLGIAFAGQIQSFSQAIARYFPEGTQVSRPAGGYLLWVQLPRQINSEKLYRQALEKNVVIIPGSMFSAQARFKNCFRISCGMAWSERTEQALRDLALLCNQQITAIRSAGGEK